MNTEAFKLARATLRIAVKDYGWHRRDSTTDRDGRPYVYGPGKFEGEHWSIVHWYDSYMGGFSDEIGDGWEAFNVDDTERAAFGLKPTDTVAVLHFSDQVVSLEYCTNAELEAFIKRTTPERERLSDLD